MVYPAGIALGGEEEWQFLWERYLESPDPYEKRLCLYALAYSKEPWILNRYSNTLLSLYTNSKYIFYFVYYSIGICNTRLTKYVLKTQFLSFSRYLEMSMADI